MPDTITFFFRLTTSSLLLCLFLSFFYPNFFLTNTGGVLHYLQPISLILCLHFGWSVFWFPFSITFLYKKNKFLLKTLFFFFIPLTFSNLAGILWLGDLDNLNYYFGSFAVFSWQLFNNLFWQILILIFYLYSIYLILASYKIVPSWKKLFRIILLLISNFIQNDKKIFYKKIFKCYHTTLSNKFFKSLESRSFFKGIKKRKRKKTKEILDSKDTYQNNSLDSGSLDELLSVFNSVNHTNKKKKKNLFN